MAIALRDGTPGEALASLQQLLAIEDPFSEDFQHIDFPPPSPRLGRAQPSKGRRRFARLCPAIQLLRQLMLPERWTPGSSPGVTIVLVGESDGQSNLRASSGSMIGMPSRIG